MLKRFEIFVDRSNSRRSFSYSLRKTGYAIGVRKTVHPKNLSLASGITGLIYSRQRPDNFSSSIVQNSSSFWQPMSNVIIDLPSGASQGIDRVTSVRRKKGNSFSGNQRTVSGKRLRPRNRALTNIIGRNLKYAVPCKAFVPFTSFARTLAG